MSGLLAALLSLAGSMTARVLLSLGFSVITVTGVNVAISALKNQAVAQLQGLPASVLQLAGLWGAWQALGIIFGAATFCVSFYTLTSAKRIG